MGVGVATCKPLGVTVLLQPPLHPVTWLRLLMLHVVQRCSGDDRDVI